MLKRYIVTGTPGSGKTTLIRGLELLGYAILEEAATDIIAYEQFMGMAEPWQDGLFVNRVVDLQKHRQVAVTAVKNGLIFADRSPICTYALARYLNHPISQDLTDEVNRVVQRKIYQPMVFFIENLGFVTSTEARKISYDEALRFEKIHMETYEEFGYKCHIIPPASIQERLEKILGSIDL